MKKFLIALQFLTILPIRIKTEIKEKEFGESLVYFPLVGIVIGIVLILTASLRRFLPDLVMAAFVLTVSIIVTGGIHLDGFADMCDGFYGSKPKEEILRIMRDSRIGAMGVMGIASVLLLKFALIAATPAAFLWKSLIMMPAFARWTQALSSLMCDYARTDGKARFFIEYARKKDVFVGGLATFVLFILMAKLKGALIFFLSLLCALLFIRYVKRKLGGMTGDTIGATSEISEVAALLFSLILLNYKI